MESINLDLGSESHKNIDVSLKNTSKQQGINIQKEQSNSNIGIDLLINKKKTTSEGVNNVKSISTSPPPETKSLNLDNELNISDIGASKQDDGIVNLDNLLSDNNPKPNDISLDDLDLNLESLEIGDSNNVTDDPILNINNEPKESIPEPVKEKTYEEIQKEKFELLCQLERLETKGVKLEKSYSMQSDFNEMKHDFDRLSSRRELDQSIRFQQKMLVAGVTAIEFLNNKFDPADIKLDGWSESIHENIHDYDDVFEELHEKYKEKAKTPPEVRLLMMLGGSAFMFHLTNTMFKSSLPAMGDIMKQNPDLMQQFAKATVNSMGNQEPEFSNLMNDMINTQGKSNRQPMPPRRPTGPSRPEMKAPPDLDSILSELGANNNSVNNIDLSSGELSESDTDGIKNLNIKLNKNNKREINLEI